ncbi:uncharacterized protein Hap1MRO34_002714 [Clarias gariepinus]
MHLLTVTALLLFIAVHTAEHVSSVVEQKSPIIAQSQSKPRQERESSVMDQTSSSSTQPPRTTGQVEDSSAMDQTNTTQAPRTTMHEQESSVMDQTSSSSTQPPRTTGQVEAFSVIDQMSFTTTQHTTTEHRKGCPARIDLLDQLSSQLLEQSPPLLLLLAFSNPSLLSTSGCRSPRSCMLHTVTLDGKPTTHEVSLPQRHDQLS